MHPLVCPDLEPLPPAEELASLLLGHLQRLDALRQTKLALSLTGSEMCANVLEREQDRNALPSGIGNKPRLRFRRRDHQQVGPDRQPVYRPCRGRAESDVGEQTLADARAGPHAKVRRMEQIVADSRRTITRRARSGLD